METGKGSEFWLFPEDDKQMNAEEQFQNWWLAYPRKIAKANARKAFSKAIKIASMEQLLEGITRYVANKPAYCDYAHPASWLNGERWSDEYEPQQAKVSITRPSENVIQHRQREILQMQYRNARDEGNNTEAARLRALIG